MSKDLDNSLISLNNDAKSGILKKSGSNNSINKNIMDSNRAQKPEKKPVKNSINEVLEKYENQINKERKKLCANNIKNYYNKIHSKDGLMTDLEKCVSNQYLENKIVSNIDYKIKAVDNNAEFMTISKKDKTSSSSVVNRLMGNRPTSSKS